MPRVEIWSEGYSVTGNASGAMFHGAVDAASLREACDVLAETSLEFRNHYDREAMTYWACRLFDNEADARKAFG